MKKLLEAITNWFDRLATKPPKPQPCQHTWETIEHVTYKMEYVYGGGECRVSDYILRCSKCGDVINKQFKR